MRPQIPELACFVKMSNDNMNTDNYIDFPADTFTPSSSSIQHSDSLGHSTHDTGTYSDSSLLGLDNDSIDYMPEELDESNIQGT